MPPRPGALLSWSGGKDAAWALHVLRGQDVVEIHALLTTIDAGTARASGQGVDLAVLRLQADAAGLPLLEVPLPQPADNATYEAGIAKALAQARSRWPAIGSLVFGDLFLTDIRQWRESLCARLGWSASFPLFARDTSVLAREMQAAGLCARLCCVDTTQLDAGFAGQAFDDALLAALPAGIDPCGENGEFHTCVSAGPMFAAPLDLVAGGTVLRDGRFAWTAFSPATRRASDSGRG